jgi:NADPH2:quinone reductase
MLTTQGGAFAERCVVNEDRVIPLPPSLSFEQGAGFIITYATSYHAFRQCAPIEPGQSVLVLGAAGGVGTTAVEISKSMGARVIAAASSDEKLAFARQAGAAETINYSELPLKETVRELTGGKGTDIVYDPVGGDLASQALQSLGWQGRYLVVGFASGAIPEFPANLLLLKERRVLGVYWGDWAAKDPGTAASNMQELAGLVAEGALNVRVSEVYPIEQFEEAFSSLAQRRALGKVVLTF